VGQSWAQQHVPDRLHRYEERLAEHPFLTILLLRILLWANPLVDLLVGVSRVSFSAYLLGTIAGLVPATAFQVVVGKKGIELAGKAPGWVWALLLVAVVLGLLMRWRRRARGDGLGAACAEGDDSDDS
jgi:uncharacterized membrane protein YdjX (TVP38/TMEM64 family)